MSAKCLNCNLIFTPSVHSKGKFCSVKCFHAFPRIRKPLTQRFWAFVKKTKGCWLWIGTLAKGKWGGYGSIRLPYGKGMIKAHRLSWEMRFGPIPKGLQVCHSCDNPACVRPDHLFVGTQSDNQKDCEKKKRRYHHNNFAGINERRRLARNLRQ